MLITSNYAFNFLYPFHGFLFTIPDIKKFFKNLNKKEVIFYNPFFITAADVVPNDVHDAADAAVYAAADASDDVLIPA